MNRMFIVGLVHVSCFAQLICGARVYGQQVSDPAQARPVVQFDSVSTDTLAARLLHRAKGLLDLAPSGSVEAGGFFGTPPFTVGGAGQVGGFLLANVSLALGGVPVMVTADLGTDAPSRGQRNRVQVSLDTKALLARYDRQSDIGLDSVGDELVRARTARSECYRRLLASRYPRMYQPPDSSALGAPGDSLLNLPIDAPTVGGDTSTTDVPELEPGHAGLPAPTPPAVVPPDTTQLHSQLDGLDLRIAELQRTHERLAALQQGVKDKRAAPGFLQGMRGLNIGSCSPSRGEFLLKGLNLQGASAEYAMHDVYVSADVGRSFDDAWRNRTRTENAIRQLQETFLLQGAQDLAPRMLTAVRAGFGLPESTHLHVGFLHGKRDALPLGLGSTGTSAGEERNDVLELDGAIALGKDHKLRAVLARSSSQSGALQNGAGASGFDAWTDRRANDNQAVMLQWSSHFDKAGTLLTLTGQLVDRHFYSMGLAFLRPGGRAGELAMEQRLGKRFTLKAGLRAEERAPTTLTGTTIRIDRYRGQCVYRPGSAWTLRAMVAPVIIRTLTADGGALTQKNLTAQGGVDWRKRIQHSRLGLHIDASRFSLAAADTLGSSAVWCVAASTSFTSASGLAVDMGLNTFTQASDTVPGMTSWSLGVQWRVNEHTAVELRAGGDVRSQRPPTGQASIKRGWGKHWTARVLISYLNSPELFFAEQYEKSVVDNYHCRLSVGYSWCQSWVPYVPQ